MGGILLCCCCFCCIISMGGTLVATVVGLVVVVVVGMVVVVVVVVVVVAAADKNGSDEGGVVGEVIIKGCGWWWWIDGCGCRLLLSDGDRVLSIPSVVVVGPSPPLPRVEEAVEDERAESCMRPTEEKLSVRVEFSFLLVPSLVSSQFVSSRHSIVCNST